MLDDPIQRYHYKKRLRSELKHFRNREVLYAEKRRELHLLE
jgi:hypothetical protein